jgi:hypothetical protein
MAGVSFEGDPIIVEVDDVKYQVKIGLDELAAIEKACKDNLQGVFYSMRSGSLSVNIQVTSIAVKKQTDVGFVALELHEIGALIANEAAGPEIGKAIGEALIPLMRALGLMAPLPAVSESGLPVASPSKTTSKRRGGQ